MTPSVSVVMPVHNGERFLRDAVDSVLAQSLSDVELVAVDDGSTDATRDILEEYARADGRVVVGRTDHVGQADARNAAVAIARADLIAFLDADDIAHPERLHQQRDFLVSHEEVGLVGGALTLIDETGHVFAEDVRYPLVDEEIRAAFSHTTPIVTSAATIRRSVFREAGGFRRLYADSEDLDLWLRVADSHRLANIARTVVRYRIHAEQATALRMERQSMTALAARLSARARAAGCVDPFDGLDEVDRDTLLALGASEEEIGESFVIPATWMARTLHRAGKGQAALKLLDEAEARVRASGSDSALAAVDRTRASIGRPTVLGRLRSLRARGR